MNRAISQTQQILLSEKQINNIVFDSFQKTGTTGGGPINLGYQQDTRGAKVNLQKAFLEKTKNQEGYITVINKNGKPMKFSISDYADMVATTKIREAQTQGTVNLALQYGSDLVQVSSHNTETEFDAQFEGKVFSLSGNDPDFPEATYLPPFHPRCKHSITVIFREGMEANGSLDRLIKESDQNYEAP
jgi:hypothetical protein